MCEREDLCSKIGKIEAKKCTVGQNRYQTGIGDQTWFTGCRKAWRQALAKKICWTGTTALVAC